MRHFEHFPVGSIHELGATQLTSEDIIGYARSWDPMPFHLDPEAARDSPSAASWPAAGTPEP